MSDNIWNQLIMELKEITICACSSRSIIDKAKAATVATALRREGYSVTIEPDLCKKAVTAPDDMKQIARTTVIACHPRAVASLFDRLGLSNIQTLDIRNQTPQALLSTMGIASVPEDTPPLDEFDHLPAEHGNDAWFPVIDKARCNDCGKCHDFCLFGVYSRIDGRVVVQQPLNCKNNCPACARVCPQTAIIFPKYEKSPINGGLTEEEGAVAIDTKSLYNAALRMKLESRLQGVSLLKNQKK